MTEILSEIDTVTTNVDIDAYLIDGENGNTKITIQSGSVGTIVLVHSGKNGVEAYEVEFYIEKNEQWALATIPIMNVTLKSKYVP